MNYPVYFENSLQERRVIGYAKNSKELFKIINDFLVAHNFTSYYTRTYKTPNNEWCLDVGSHSEFFYVSSELSLA